MTRPSRPSRLYRLSRRLRRSTSGVAMVEFALAMPFFLAAGLGGIETANFSISSMRVAQMAIHIADNASRVGDTSTLEDRKVYESDINDVFVGAHLQGGRLDFFDHGRAVVSSLEVHDPDGDGDGPQYIHWQRCMGKKAFVSAYGGEGTGTDGSLPGMGPAGEEVIALPGDAVIFVEVSYDYQPLVSEMFAFRDEVTSVASFNVRDKRDLTGLFQRDDANPDPVADCDTYETVSLPA